MCMSILLALIHLQGHKEISGYESALASLQSLDQLGRQGDIKKSCPFSRLRESFAAPISSPYLLELVVKNVPAPR